MSESPFRITNLSVEQRSLLELRLQEKREHAARASIAPRREETSSAPLSFAQQRLWFLNQLEPDSPLYNCAGAMRLTGVLDITALGRAINEIVRRHEVLRTTFPICNGEPQQRISPEQSPALLLTDLSGLTDPEQESEVPRIVAAAAQRRFDLARGPLVRVELLKLNEQEHVFILTMHHIVSDRWSIGIFMRELASLYAAFTSGLPSPLPPLPIQYADYACWQRTHLNGPAFERQLAYWRNHLSGAPTMLALGGVRSEARSWRGGRQRLEIERETVVALRALAQSEGATLFMMLLASYRVVLSRWSGQAEVVVGTPIAGRVRVEVEGLIGFFVNTLGLRGEVRERESVREMLRREREVCLGGYGAQEVPFEKVVEEMEPERSLTHSPIFQAMLVYQNAPVPTMKLPGLTLTVLEFSPGVSKADISLLSVDDGDNLSCLLEYSTDLFDDVTMARMAGHLETLLRAIAANPEQRVGELSMLTEAERRQILVEWNDTSAPYPKERCVHQVFEAHAARNPNAPALEDRDGQLTYGELNRRANRLAHYLRARGVGPDVPVGLCLERSPAWVTGVLGILKAGGAYVSLDPTYPKERLAVMMEDARVPILVTMRRWLADSLIPKQMQTICLDDDWEEIEAESEQNPESGVTPQNLAYIVYTSGSTGRPKGVTTTHGSLLNLVCWHNRAFEVTSADRAGQVARMGFDASVLEMWPIFNAGASLHLIDEETRLSPEKIKQWLVDNRITFSFLPPALSESILFEDWPENTSLRIMTSGSDRLLHCPPESLRFKYVNQYGPTEATVIVTTCEVQPQTQERAAPHIGRPLANTQIYLLNSFMQPVAVGLTGELYIGGDSLARGYLHDPKLTAEKFVPNPFSPRPGARLYRTGDLARYLPGGEIEFLGRADEQVKVRGFRIELGEVRSVLLQHPAVETGIVIVREDTPGDKRLVAYLVFREQPAPTAEELRAFLRVQLPEYMLPTAFMALDRLPLTPNSKVDLRMLPAPDWGRPDMEGSTALPRTPLEASLAEIFADVLGVVSVGVHQNFFSLGGHSLLATHLLTRVRDALRIDLPLRNLFEGPTVAELAAAIEAHMPAADLPAPPEVEVIARGDKSLDDLLAELNAMSEEEADALMADERRLNN